MYFTNCTIWLSAIVLQGGTIHSAPKWITEDVIKSSLMYYKCFFHFTNLKFKAIVKLISIYLYLSKISRRHHLRVAFLSQQYAINSLLDEHHSKKAKLYHLSLVHLTQNQYLKIKGSIVDSNNCLNKVYPSFPEYVTNTTSRDVVHKLKLKVILIYLPCSQIIH